MRKLSARALYGVYLLLVAEATLQLYYYFTAGQWLATRTAAPLFASNPYSGYWNKPNIDLLHRTNEFSIRIYTNRQGFRVSSAREEYALGPNPSRYRILLLGPSFAFGWGVNYEQTLGHRLQEILEEAGFSRRPIELINAGVPGLAPSSQLNWYKNQGRLYQPDLVVQLMYGSLAVSSNLDLSQQEVTSDGYLVNKGIGVAARLREEMKKSGLVFYSWVFSTRLAGLLGRDKGNSEILGAGREMRLHAGFDPSTPEVLDSLRYYEDLRETVKATGARLLIVHFPLSYCVHRGDVTRWRHLGVRDIDTQIRFEELLCQDCIGGESTVRTLQGT